MERALGDELARVLGAAVRRASPLSGGDINDAYEVQLEDGRRVFVKANARSPSGMFEAEAHGLAWLAEARALRVPEVLAFGGGDGGVPAFLVLEFLERARPRRGFDEELGRGLAELHRAGSDSFGFREDNFIGRLPQSNRARARWVDFYREERLGAQLTLAEKSGLATAKLRRGFERLFARLADLLGPEEPPARLHGDLWGGNLHVGPAGEPCLIDPAVYAGHREIDLAMMRLFGGFGERVFQAYAEAFPLAEGHEDRVPLYQLYPLMVHVNLFGGGYVSSVERILARY
jgi:fructosamine-3-kinase